MRNIEEKYSLKPGDVLVCNKSIFGMIEHLGLYVGNGSVIDNHPERGVSLIKLSKFLDDGSIKRVIRTRGGSRLRDNIVNKAYSYIGEKYHLTNFNCEHFVNEVRGLGRKSDQVAVYGGLALSALVVWGISKMSK